MATNKFLGLDSINVLKEYIDKTIQYNNDNARVLTLQIYKYVLSGKTAETPVGGSFDPVGARLTYPDGWGSLNSVIRGFTPEENDADVQNAAIENALKNGSIYMSAGVLEGGSNFSNWSSPVKISGQNGVNIQFEYSYNADGTERDIYPKGVDSANRKEYVWIKYGDDEWKGPFLWAVYAADATDVLYRYCVTATDELPALPASDADANWMTSAAVSISLDKPYMWMTSKKVPAGMNSSECQWSDPILFGHYGIDGNDGKDGLDGNIPAYSITLYAKTDIIDGQIVKPEFVCNVGDNITDVKELNSETWNELPLSGNENSIWWYVVVNVNGGDKDNPDVINTVAGISEVMRFSAIDGDLKSYSKVKYRYYWSDTQTLPDDITEWSDTPVYNANEVEGSLWMSTAEFVVNTVTNTEEQTKDWSEPVKLSGPRGPIAYDYRIETRYNIGTSEKPKSLPTESEWTKHTPDTTSQYPYIWAVNYLMLYKMKYDNNGDIVTADNGKLLETYSHFRLSGINGEDGNRKNSLKYSNEAETISVTSFSENNLYIANSTADVTYNINLDQLSFINGYTGKFANIGTGKMIINGGKYKFIGSCKEATIIELEPQEQIELVCYNNDTNKELLVIGKSL